MPPMLSNRIRVPGGAVRVAVVALGAFGLLVWLRGDALLSPVMINPDEAELLAEGKRAMLSLVPYRDYTSTTHLFLWPLVLGLLGRLGFALSLPTAHFLSGIAYLYLVLVGWYALSRYVHWLYALACITPAALVLFAARRMTGPDYVALNTELLPIVLLTGALLLIHTGDPSRWRPRLAFAAALIGASVMAKPQVLPLAGGFLVACVAAVWAQRSFALGHPEAGGKLNVRATAVWAVVFGIAPWICAVAWMAVAGTLHAFIEESVWFQIDYIFNREQIEGAAWAVDPPSAAGRLTGIADLLSSIPVAFLVLVAAGDARSGSVLLSRGWPGRRRRNALVVLFGVTFCAIVTCAGSWPLFTHYGNFVYAGCILAAVSSCAMLGPRSARQVTTGSKSYRIAALIVAPALVLSLLIASRAAFVGSTPENVLTQYDDGETSPEMRWDALRRPNLAIPGAASGPAWDTIRSHCPTGERVMVWGWAAELYSYNDWTSPTRYVDSHWQLLGLSKRAVYARRLAQELTARPPVCIVEGIGPAFFGEFGTDRGIATTLPGLTAFLDRCYVERVVEPAPMNPVKYYVRRAACDPRG
jgi:hypothetical protein